MIKQRRADLKRMIKQAINSSDYSAIGQLSVEVERVRAEAVSV